MKKLSSHQKVVIVKLQSKFGEDWFTVEQCIGLALGRPDFTLWNMAENGLLIKELNPNRKKPDVMGWTTWRYKLPDTTECKEKA